MKLELPGKKAIDLSVEYQEESILVPILITVMAVTLVCAPFVWTIKKINSEGIRSAEISKYTMLIQAVDSDSLAVQTLLELGAEEMNAIVAKMNDPGMVIEEFIEVKHRDESQESSEEKPLDVDLEGIYWNPANPIAGINGETYHVGDSVQGYEIVKIGKTDVHFKRSDGEIIVKDFYDDLLQKNN